MPKSCAPGWTRHLQKQIDISFLSCPGYTPRSSLVQPRENRTHRRPWLLQTVTGTKSHRPVPSHPINTSWARYPSSVSWHRMCLLVHKHLVSQQLHLLAWSLIQVIDPSCPPGANGWGGTFERYAGMEGTMNNID